MSPSAPTPERDAPRASDQPGGPRIQLLCHPWALAGDGGAHVIDRVQNELGFDGIEFVAVGSPLAALRFDRTTGPMLVESRGGLHVTADPKHYERTRCKPTAADGAKSGGAIAKAVAACHGRGLSVSFYCRTRRIGRLVARNPQVVARTAFDEPMIGCACPANPDLAHFLAGVLADLEPLKPASVTLADLSGPICTEWLDPLPFARRVDSFMARLLSICFCPSCLQSAGKARINTEAARRAVMTTIHRVADSADPPPSFDEWVDDHRAIADMIALSEQGRRALLASLSDVAACPLFIETDETDETQPYPATPTPTEGQAATNHRQAAIGRSVRVTLPMATECADALKSRLSGTAPGEPLRAAVDLRQSLQPTALVKGIKDLTDLGVDSILLCDHDSLTPSLMTACRQAVRFATRQRPLPAERAP